ncbi:sensor histidine kinase [Fusibacter ferrireducens]|uniref:histidine kinase n=1 Tax=Fusibacter ferrireducens TaxID=2785058 RepID=A0ABR9ZUN4_9FIRM|nr:sensor histidine kinase [Fusibacter ferrireducens]MBF4693289.1 sensor histidine kinase [Fusibacter ferrireducens]
MENKVIHMDEVQNIMNKTIQAIDDSRDQLLDIVETAREEYDLLKAELANLKRDIDRVISEVDRLSIKDKMVRNHLANVSKAFNTHTEEDIKQAYERASDVRIELTSIRKEEELLKTRRSMLEISMKRSMKNIQNAEHVVNQVTIAVSYLKGEIFSAIEDMGAESMLLGVKILEAQENERRRISRDIHDGPAQQIASIVMKAEFCERIIKNDFEKGMRELAEMKAATKKALKEVRDIIQDLRPMSLDEIGLNEAIETYAVNYGKTHQISVKTRIKKMTFPVEAIIQVAVFRLVQEILNNVKKHAKASQVNIELEYDAVYLRLIVADDGVGFDLEKTLKKIKMEHTSFGLLGLYERVNQLRGELEIVSEFGEGTTCTIKLPINREVIAHERQ